MGTIHKKIKIALRLARRKLRQAVRWWRLQNRRWGIWWRVGNGLAALLIVVSIAIPLLNQMVQSRQYRLAAATLKLVGATDQKLTKQLTYNAATQTYQFNKDAIQSDESNPLTKLKAQVGTASGSKNDKSLYALDVPEDISKGVTYHDINSQLSFSLVPQFKAQAGKEEQGHLVFPLSGDAQAIYTLKNNGLKEDIVVQKATTNTMSFDYNLGLPKTLEAKMIPDSGGAIGIYSADPALFGDISYGTPKDQASVEKARENSPKTHLVFGLPSPVIKASDGASVGNANAQFQLEGSKLSVIASGLSGLHTPVTIDPSVVVTSTSDFQTAGNNEDNIDFSTSGQITRAGLTGGSIGSYTTNTDTGTVYGFRLGFGAVAYNGYLYIAGGNTTPVNDVYYAPLNSNGSLGAWATTTSFTTARVYMGMVAYNGYMYLYGGWASGANAQSDVQYAKIDPSTGALQSGSWSLASNSMYLGVCRAGYAAYNGYLYATGGDNVMSGSCGNSSTPTNTVQYAPILGNGDVGAWASTTSFTTARESHQTVAYNGYIYVVSGTVTGAGGLTDVQYAPLNSDGTVGTWMTTTSVPAFRYRFGMTVYNGYIYITGGGAGGATADTIYVQINANGTLGAWQTDNSTFATGRWGHASVTYNGYLYVTGGNNGTGPTQNDTQYAKIDPAGQATTWTTTTAAHASGTGRPGQTTGAAAVAYNNFIYVVGGFSTKDSAYSNYVEYAPLNSDGTIGTWNATSTLATTTGQEGAVAYNGFMYALGGFNTAGSSGQDKVQYAAINSNGTLGTWAQTSTLLHVKDQQRAVAYNGYLYSWGNGSAASNLVEYSLVCTGNNSGVGGCGATPGTVGTWTATSTLNTLRFLDVPFAYGGYMYVIGGVDNTSTTLKTIEYALICTGSNSGVGGCGATAGALGTWTTNGTSMNTERDKFLAYASNGYVYVVGGEDNTNTALSTTESAPINSNGSIGTWNFNTVLPATILNSSGAIYNGYAYSLSGMVAGARSLNSYYALINNGGTGATGAWGSTTSFNTGRAYHATVAYNGYMYVMGGLQSASNTACNGTASTACSDVQYAPINANGTIGTWHYTHNSTDDGTLFVAGFTNPRFGLSAAAYNGYMYIMGGFNNSSTYYNDVQYAPINANGTIGTWTSTASFINVRYGHKSAIYNGYMYIMGGVNSSTAYNDVQYAPINANGTIGTWHYTHNSTDDGTTFVAGFTTARWGLASAVYNGYLYVMGGASTGPNLNDVQYAPINANGTIGTWNSTSSFNLVRYYLSAIAYNGFMYILGGLGDLSDFNDVQYAPINANGTIGTWTSTTSFSTARDGLSSAVYNGSLYILGGNGAGIYNDVQYAPLNTLERAGHYSKLVDLGAAVNIASLTYHGTTQAGVVTVTYKAAGSNGVFGSSALASTISGSGGCLGNTTNTQYLLVTVTLDDSYGLGTGGVFPDINGTNANLTDFTVNYSPVHPPPNIRLRTGQTLQNGNLSALDTCYP